MNRSEGAPGGQGERRGTEGSGGTEGPRRQGTPSRCRPGTARGAALVPCLSSRRAARTGMACKIEARDLMETVLFACVHNAGRSQMAAALFNRLADPSKARAVSAGTEPAAGVHPEVVAAMRELGIDLGAMSP